jgi:hypothetical protein
MMVLRDYDFYYLIICSRGLGSETITVNKVSSDDTFEWAEDAKKDLKKFGVCEVVADWNDEGPILAVPTGTKPLNGIYQWLKKYTAKWEEESDAVFAIIGEDMAEDLTGLAADERQMMKDLDALLPRQEPLGSSLLSAMLRVFTSTNLKHASWTSSDGWRNVNWELPSKRQFELLMDATGHTATQLGQWDCKVLQKAAELYKQKKLSTTDFEGC